MSDQQQLQMVVAEVQNARQQVAALTSQIKEIELTLEAIESHPEDKALHQQRGAVLIEVTDRGALVTELTDTLTRMNQALEMIKAREAELIEAYESLKKSIEE
jgi:chaperonin cofactor prefoldin